MNVPTQTAVVHYDPVLNFQELSPSLEVKSFAWPVPEKNTKFSDFTLLNSVAYSQNDTEVFELVQKATKHILAMGFLTIDESDDKMVDRLVAQRVGKKSTRPL